MVKLVDIVTVLTGTSNESRSFNLCELDADEALLWHPLHSEVYIVKNKDIAGIFLTSTLRDLTSV